MIGNSDPAALQVAVQAAEDARKQQAAAPASDGSGSWAADLLDGPVDFVATGIGDLLGSAVGVVAEGAGAVISGAGKVVGAVVGGIINSLG